MMTEETAREIADTMYGRGVARAALLMINNSANLEMLRGFCAMRSKESLEGFNSAISEWLGRKEQA